MAAISRPYVLTAGAANDIREIARYTDQQWGKQQRHAYVAQLEKAANDLALGQGVLPQAKRTTAQRGLAVVRSPEFEVIRF